MHIFSRHPADNHARIDLKIPGRPRGVTRTGYASGKFSPIIPAIRWLLVFFLSGYQSDAQVTGGQFAFEYLRMSNSPLVSAMGGISIATPENDISLALQNPAIMRPGLHNELELNYNNFYAGISISNLAYGYYAEKVNTAFFFGLQYINYGNIAETDPTGSQYGSFHPVDYAATLGASRQYLDNWRYGADLKFANSDLYAASGTAALMDVGINYYDTSSLWDVGATAKNMGIMIKKYDPAAPAEPVPFDLQLGVSKRLKHMPLRLFMTIHHLYEWDIRYDNPTDLIGTNSLGQTDTVKNSGSQFADKLFRHFIFGGELSLGKHLTVTVSYNDLQRREMAISTDPGLAGFAFGLGLYLNKFQVHYARTYYHVEGPYNELGITMALNKLFGLGQWGEKVKWNAEYDNWK